MQITNYSNIMPSEGKTFFEKWRKEFNKKTRKKAEVSMVGSSPMQMTNNSNILRADGGQKFPFLVH